MEQQVYSTGGSYGIRLLQQNPDEQQQQHFIMADNDQSQHIVYSPVKSNEISQAQNQQQHQTQFITQDDSIPNQYLIQQSPTHQQVFYANVATPNQNANRIIQQTVALNHNLIQQQKVRNEYF